MKRDGEREKKKRGREREREREGGRGRDGEKNGEPWIREDFFGGGWGGGGIHRHSATVYR